MLERLKIKLQYLLPRQGLTLLAGWGANKQAGWLSQLAIKSFVWYYKVDMKEAQHSELATYRSFNEFFVRRLADNARPITAGDHLLVQPADGTISQLGTICDGKILQAKEHHYSLEALLAGNYLLAEEFKNGQFVTTYLAPRDYHRVHMPCGGTLREMIYVPGDLFSVNQLTSENITNLFARNERVICIFDTAFGSVAQILVGATIVGSIETVWESNINSAREGIIQRWTYPSTDDEGAIKLEKGQEMGHFKLGSTVINLFASNKIHLAPHLSSESVARMGEPLAEAVMLEN
ncbi:phosphatidylserine decarboxylase [Candidatus Regiella insecticola LSR1]|uniref:Phosphatidylserine decarboxylase proenzyme n=1 Tax=Candidatus Regiella insecticola LSR1 TaxID=663321 RepID=E0WTB9_9ENTR|nr:archaetidylserine decarboxylase [Candidatus Regiella insecticola]EFL91804.1 phosphatidylserine decarboxylase [Candidatus Regiella insecticola LSR1]